MSAAFLCAGLEITNSPRLDHAQYLSHWLEVLKGDTKAIFTAASLATRAVDYLHSLQPKSEPGVEHRAVAQASPSRPIGEEAAPEQGRRGAGGPR